MKTNTWSLPTRLLHMGMALTISLQLLISLIMEAPDESDASALAQAAFEAHEVVGMAALLVVVLHWLWNFSSQASGGMSHLFPWYGKALGEVKSDLTQLIQGKLPESGQRGGLPGLVHGLGFLAVTSMAISGGILFFIFPEAGEPNNVVEFFEEIHEFIATFVWAYWIGHIAFGVMHKLAGHTTVEDMFKLKS